MLDLGQLKKDIQTLNNGDDAACRLALQSLKAYKEDEWESGAASNISSLVEVLRRQLSNHPLLKGTKQPSIHKDVAIILGNIGPRPPPLFPN